MKYQKQSRKRIHRFYVEGFETLISAGTATVDNETIVHQWVHVLRFNTGDEVICFDGGEFEYHAQIALIDAKKAIKLNIVSKEPAHKPKRDVDLYMALIKKDNLEWVVQKATELGVTRIIPFEASRSEKKSIDMKRLMRIATEAVEQSGWGLMPKIEDICSFNEATKTCFADSARTDKVYIAHTGQNTPLSADVVAHNDSVAIWIGPEGGFTEEEVESVVEAGAETVSLGDGILRAETAAVVAAAVFTVFPFKG